MRGCPQRTRGASLSPHRVVVLFAQQPALKPAANLLGAQKGCLAALVVAGVDEAGVQRLLESDKTLHGARACLRPSWVFDIENRMTNVRIFRMFESWNRSVWAWA